MNLIPLLHGRRKAVSALSEWDALGLSDGLISYWSMDNRSVDDLTVYDSFGSNNGTAVNSPTFSSVDGINNDYVALDGVNEKLTINNFRNLIDFSGGCISLWARSNLVHEGVFYWHFVVGSNQRFYLTVNKNDKSTLYAAMGSAIKATNTGTFVINKWYNLVTSWNGTQYKFYMDGQEMFTQSYTYVSPTTDGFELGWGNSINQVYLNGSIDEVAIWNRALSPTEVENIYNSGAGRFLN